MTIDSPQLQDETWIQFSTTETDVTKMPTVNRTRYQKDAYYFVMYHTRYQHYRVMDIDGDDYWYAPNSTEHSARKDIVTTHTEEEVRVIHGDKVDEVYNIAKKYFLR